MANYGDSYGQDEHGQDDIPEVIRNMTQRRHQRTQEDGHGSAYNQQQQQPGPQYQNLQQQPDTQYQIPGPPHRVYPVDQGPQISPAFAAATQQRARGASYCYNWQQPVLYDNYTVAHHQGYYHPHMPPTQQQRHAYPPKQDPQGVNGYRKRRTHFQPRPQDRYYCGRGVHNRRHDTRNHYVRHNGHRDIRQDQPYERHGRDQNTTPETTQQPPLPSDNRNTTQNTTPETIQQPPLPSDNRNTTTTNNAPQNRRVYQLKRESANGKDQHQRVDTSSKHRHHKRSWRNQQTPQPPATSEKKTDSSSSESSSEDEEPVVKRPRSTLALKRPALPKTEPATSEKKTDSSSSESSSEDEKPVVKRPRYTVALKRPALPKTEPATSEKKTDGSSSESSSEDEEPVVKRPRSTVALKRPALPKTEPTPSTSSSDTENCTSGSSSSSSSSSDENSADERQVPSLGETDIRSEPITSAVVGDPNQPRYIKPTDKKRRRHVRFSDDDEYSRDAVSDTNQPRVADATTESTINSIKRTDGDDEDDDTDDDGDPQTHRESGRGAEAANRIEELRITNTENADATTLIQELINDAPINNTSNDQQITEAACEDDQEETLVAINPKEEEPDTDADEARIKQAVAAVAAAAAAAATEDLNEEQTGGTSTAQCSTTTINNYYDAETMRAIDSVYMPYDISPVQDMMIVNRYRGPSNNQHVPDIDYTTDNDQGPPTLLDEILRLNFDVTDMITQGGFVCKNVSLNAVDQITTRTPPPHQDPVEAIIATTQFPPSPPPSVVSSAANVNSAHSRPHQRPTTEIDDKTETIIQNEIKTIETTAPPSTNSQQMLIFELSHCSLCDCAFNDTVICAIKYTVGFNQPIQCMCGCVVCTRCYSNANNQLRVVTCTKHKAKLKTGIVNTTANRIAHWQHVFTDRKWSMTLDLASGITNVHVRDILDRTDIVNEEMLNRAFTVLLNAGDRASFEWSANTPMKRGDAYRYVAMSHTRDFWNHIATGSRKPTLVQAMLEPARCLCRLFNVAMDKYTFHWACFVFNTQVLLAMWCQDGDGVQLTLTEIPTVIDTQEFRLMTYFLHKWVELHYGNNTVVNVVLNTAACEMLPSLVDVVMWIAAKCDIKTPPIDTPSAAAAPRNRGINNASADEFFMYPRMTTENADVVDISQMFNEKHHPLYRDAETSSELTYSSRYAIM